MASAYDISVATTIIGLCGLEAMLTTLAGVILLVGFAKLYQRFRGGATGCLLVGLQLLSLCLLLVAPLRWLFRKLDHPPEPTKAEIQFKEFLAETRNARESGPDGSARLIGRIAIWHDSPGRVGNTRDLLLTLGGPVRCPERETSYFIARSGCQIDARTAAGYVRGPHLTAPAIQAFFDSWARSPSEVTSIVYLVSKSYSGAPYRVYNLQPMPSDMPYRDVSVDLMETTVRVIDRRTHTYPPPKTFKFDAPLPDGTEATELYPSDEKILDYLVSLPKSPE